MTEKGEIKYSYRYHAFIRAVGHIKGAPDPTFRVREGFLKEEALTMNQMKEGGEVGGGKHVLGI